MTSVPGFLTKTFEIFSSHEYSDCCCWGSNGDTIVIRKIEEFSKNILPKYFKHSNFQSFVRQLNMYDFHKTVQDPNHGEFTHQYFRQHKPELLVYIKRKANKVPDLVLSSNTQVVTSETSKLDTLIASATEIHNLTMFDHLEEQHSKNKDLEDGVIRSFFYPIENSCYFDTNTMIGIETRLNKLEDENKILRNQMQRVIQNNNVIKKRIRKIIDYIKKKKILRRSFHKLS